MIGDSATSTCVAVIVDMKLCLPRVYNACKRILTVVLKRSQCLRYIMISSVTEHIATWLYIVIYLRVKLYKSTMC